MKRSLKAWNKFHLINAAHNAGTTHPEKMTDKDDRRTGSEIVAWAKKIWSKPDSGVSEQDVDDMFLHLLRTGQVVFLCGRPFDPANEPNYMSLFITIGTVVFEQDIEGHQVTAASERAARKILENMDDRRGSSSKNWPDDVRDEAVNTWAALIDEAKDGTPTT